jgi:hypothetical protein
MNRRSGLDDTGSGDCQRFTLPSGKTVDVAKLSLQFRSWAGSPLRDTYGNKAIIDVEGEPLFAELAILRMLERQGWQGVWVDTYRRKFRRSMPPCVDELPYSAKVLFDSIVSNNAGRQSGCWDVFAWKDAAFLFAESKRKGRDRIRASQTLWLEAAIAAGLPLSSFCMVEWELKEQTRSRTGNVHGT